MVMTWTHTHIDVMACPGDLAAARSEPHLHYRVPTSAQCGEDPTASVSSQSVPIVQSDQDKRRQLTRAALCSSPSICCSAVSVVMGCSSCSGSVLPNSSGT